MGLEMEYLINVLMAGASPIIIGAVLYIASRLISDIDGWETHNRIRLGARYLGITCMVVGLVVGLSSPSNTYKNQTFDTQESYQKIERINSEKRANAPTEVQDLTKQRISAEERKAAFDAMVDYKKQ